jgi:alanine racemase
MHRPLRLRCSSDSLAGNFECLQARAGVQAGAAIKADAYGTGAAEASDILLKHGCRDFFVSTWWEASQLKSLPGGTLAVLHGWGPQDSFRPGVRPVLNSAEQIARWRASGLADHECDLMVDTGMNRLGIRPEEVGAASGLRVNTLHSHLACADEDHPLNQLQLRRFLEVRAAFPQARASLANSAGIFLGQDYSFDLVRPGLALYGGVPRSEAAEVIRPVVSLQAQVIQLRTVEPGESIGYNATFTSSERLTAAVLNLGYADGFWRDLGVSEQACFDGRALQIVGRISMDMLTVDATSCPQLREGDWVDLSFDLVRAARASGLSQYELLTGLGRRFERVWY